MGHVPLHVPCAHGIVRYRALEALQGYELAKKALLNKSPCILKQLCYKGCRPHFWATELSFPGKASTHKAALLQKTRLSSTPNGQKEIWAPNPSLGKPSSPKKQATIPEVVHN